MGRQWCSSIDNTSAVRLHSSTNPHKVKGIGGHAPATFQGTIQWIIQDDDGKTHICYPTPTPLEQHDQELCAPPLA